MSRGCVQAICIMLQLKALMKLLVAVFVVLTILMPAVRAVSKHEPTDLLDDDEPEPFDDFEVECMR